MSLPGMILFVIIISFVCAYVGKVLFYLPLGKVGSHPLHHNVRSVSARRTIARVTPTVGLYGEGGIGDSRVALKWSVF